MRYDEARNEDVGKTEDRLRNLQYLLGLINIVCFVIALANFSICIWIRFDLDFWEWIVEIGWYTYWNCMYIVMVAMLFVAANNALSFFGTFTESPGMLLTSMIFRGIIFCVTLAGGVMISLYGVEESKLLINELNEVFLGLVYKWDMDPRASRVMRMVQEYVGCCGAGGNRDDYINAHKPVPRECRHPVTGNNYQYGCGQTLAWWLEPWTATLAGISVFFCATDFVIMGITNKLRRTLSRLN